jgi:lia operon protein LiaF
MKMGHKINSDFMSWALLMGTIALLLEISFFNQGVIFSLLVAIGMIYIGRKRMPRLFGKLLFWVGIIFFAVSIFNMMTFKFFLLAIFIHLLLQFARSKKSPATILPVVKTPAENDIQEPLIKKKPLFENILFGDRKTPEHVYEWNDINLQTAIGDTVIDFSYTVLPKGETVIFIHNIIGNVKVLVPYDVEVCVNHSVIAGSTTIFGLKEEKVFNQSIVTHTEGYEKAEQKIKIFTSFLIGDLEVKRV